MSVVPRVVVRVKGEWHVDVNAQLLLHRLKDVRLVEAFSRGRVSGARGRVGVEVRRRLPVSGVLAVGRGDA